MSANNRPRSLVCGYVGGSGGLQCLCLVYGLNMVGLVKLACLRRLILEMGLETLQYYRPEKVGSGLYQPLKTLPQPLSHSPQVRQKPRRILNRSFCLRFNSAFHAKPLHSSPRVTRCQSTSRTATRYPRGVLHSSTKHRVFSILDVVHCRSMQFCYQRQVL